jgi:hypothetical protein
MKQEPKDPIASQHKRRGRPPLGESAKIAKRFRTLEVHLKIRGALEQEKPRHSGKDRLIQAKLAVAKRLRVSLKAVRLACESKDPLVLKYENLNRAAELADNRPIAKSPTLSPAPGCYPRAQRIKLSCDTDDAVIQYRLGESAEWKRYQKGVPLRIDSSVTVEAYADASGYRRSRHVGGVYFIGKNVVDKAAMIKMAHQCEPESSADAQIRYQQANSAK